ncbi:MAG: protein kinase [Nitrospirota bacterium]
MNGKIKKIIPSGLKESCYSLEIELPEKKPSTEPESLNKLQFHFCSELVNTLPQDVVYPFLQSMTFSHIKKGKRLITQGEKGDNFYLILKGTCIVNQEKNDRLFEIDNPGPGDIVGEMALFDEERRSAHVYAETDMDLLSMEIDQFRTLSQEYPELWNFISEVIARRLISSKLIDDRKIGKYMITGKIAYGGSGLIFKGSHTLLDMPVAIKMLKHELAVIQDFTEAFLNEARTIAQLNHPNVIRVYDIEGLYQTIFIIMEYLDGVTLKNMLKNNKLSLLKVLYITLQVCFGLEYAHKHGIIHQDINPQNIFITSDGQVKIIDFGLACFRGCVDTNFFFPGTVFYISPEQIRGDPVDECTDIYSPGITVYEMLTGRVPFPGDEVRTVINAHLQENFPDTRTIIHDLPEELHNFLRRATQKETSARYQNISEILAELLPLSERLGVKTQSGFCR